jgi:tRNA(fMet)-specific endonuclease VapC
MSIYALDTDILSLFEKKHPAIVARVRSHDPSELAITVLTVEEQLSGWYTEVRKAKHPERLARAYRELARTVRFLSRLQILDYDEAAIERYEELRKQKVKIRRMDLRIAVCVLTRPSAILVTRNARDFKQVPGLQIEDWSQ